MLTLTKQKDKQTDTPTASKHFSWQEAVIYQIYPWTFHEDTQRSPQKGVGSIRGIIEKLPYVKDDVGADAIWLSPFYASPMVDGGYDISDYKDVHPDLGTLGDVEEMVKSAHEVGLKVMLDLVPNHTSDQHEWFIKSRNKEEGYEDWYIWHPGKLDDQGNRIPPNNWASVFSLPNKKARERGELHLRDEEWTPPVSAWTWDDGRGEYYLHSFAKEQPDLNWSNPLVREGMKDVMRFWLDRGVDGFRVDAVNHTGKNMSFADEEVNTAYNEGYENPYDQLLKYNSCGYPEALHKYIWEMCEVLRDESYGSRDLRMILEAYMGEADLRALNDIAPDIATTFNFGAMNLVWGALERKIQTDYYYHNLPSEAVGNQVNGNHDMTRLATRMGDSISRTAAVMNLFLPGMRFIYNGEELGLHDNTDIPFERMRDTENGYRDGGRTPIIWDDSQPNSGFSQASPESLWLPVNESDADRSVVTQMKDATSPLSLYRSAIKLCRELPAIRSGAYTSLHSDNLEVLAYERAGESQKVVVVVNFSPYVQHAHLVVDFASSKTVLSSIDVTQHTEEVNLEDGVHLQPNEALVIVST